MTTGNRFKTFDFWDGFIFGATFLSIISIGLIGIFSELSSNDRTMLATLTAIPAALGAALVAMWIARYQVNYARRQELSSAKAVLPLALTKLINISNNAILISSGRHSNPLENIEDVRKLFSLDADVIQIIRDNIRSADPITQSWLAIIIGRYQIYFSRIDNWFNSELPKINYPNIINLNIEREDALLDWATLHALVSHQFGYARESVGQVPINMEIKLIRYAFSHNIFAVTFDDRFERRIIWYTKCLASGHRDLFSFNR